MADENAATMLAQTGRVAMWFPVDSRNYDTQRHISVAQFLAAHHVDTACVKVADGTIRWYTSPADVANLRQLYNQHGVGFIPFIYSYCDKFGADQIAGTADLVKELWAAGLPVVQLDLEVEWNGKVAQAQELASLLRPVPGLLSVSTWADPVQQDWEAVARALAPAVNAWTPQEYTNYLAGLMNAQYDPAVFTCLQPGIDLTQEFGANDQASIARAGLLHGHETFYLWHLEIAQQNPDLLDQLVGIIKAGQASTPAPIPAPNPSPAPVPAPTGYRAYVVENGDTLSGIVLKLHLGYGWHTLYQQNMATIEAAARAHGQPNSDGGNLIYPGETLHYQA